MISSLNAATSPVDAQEGAMPLGAVSPHRDGAVLWFGEDDETGPRPAPANWRGCGYRRRRTTLNGGRTA